MQIALLHNPLSGFNRRHPGALAQAASEFEQVRTHAVESPAGVQAALMELTAYPPDLLIICGGDGTVQAVLSALFATKPFVQLPPLAVLAAGTTNMIAADAGLPGNPVKNLQGLLALRSRAGLRCVKRPVLRLQMPGQEDRYGMFLGMAAISQGSAYYQEHLHNQGWQGLPGIVLTLFRFLAAAMARRARKHLSCRLSFSSTAVSQEEEPEQGVEALLAVVSTHERLLFGLKPFWGRKAGGPLRCTLVETEARGLAWRLPFLAWGQSWAAGAQGYRSWNAKQLRFRLDGPLSLDGELYRATQAHDPILVSCGGTVDLVREI